MGENISIGVFGGRLVGKSAFVVQYVQRIFLELPSDPTVDDLYRKTVEFQGIQCIGDILDSTTSVSAAIMKRLYFKTYDGFILLYSITDQESLKVVEELYQEIVQVREVGTFPLVVVGNKSDLEVERRVTTAAGKSVAERCGNCSFTECSAKSQKSVDEVFYDLAQQIMRERSLKQGSKNRCVVQ
eukprot:TRINITY_DN2466_c0_g1_i1.p1 TRINITY_DN2466_c0_g1~~TRINITY_DN2466_c0_g1_i1.p1  ORF type:complete len:185 (-),score=33.16 TRINITY_DN2466_c0_g1_i1:43-597(-)